MKNSITREYLPWVDVLRIVACFMVVLCHACDAFVGTFDGSDIFVTGVFWGSTVRACVPLFAMMSGILLFPVTTDLSTFYKKRIGRIVIPLVFWSIALPIAFYLYLNFGKESNSALIDMENYSLQAILSKIGTSIFNFNYDTTPLWYIYMLVGLYLIIPIFGVWLNSATKKDIQIFLSFWGVSLFIPYIKILAPLAGYSGNWGSMGIWGVCNWNEFGTFYYFSGFLGYIILAYYLVKYPLQWTWAKTWTVAGSCFAIGFAITFFSFLTIQKYFPADVANLEQVWYFCNINVALMTFAIFIIFQKIKIQPSAFIKKVSGATFGIFLVHFVLVQMATDVFLDLSFLPTTAKIWSIAILSFLVSYCITRAMEYSRFTSRFVK